MKKICILVSNIYAVGGCERVAANLANSFCERYEVIVINGFDRQEQEVYSLDSGVRIISLIEGKTHLRSCYFKAIKKLHNILVTLKPDVTLLINTGTYVFLPAFWKTKTKCVACEHTNLKNKFHTTSLISKLERLYAVWRCDKIVTLTFSDKKNYEKKYKISPDKVVNIYNWIDSEIYKYHKVQSDNKKRILSVGRFDPVKGYDILIEVALKVLPNHKDWEWHIYGAGDNEYKEDIIQKIRKNNLDKQLILKKPEKSIYKKYSEYSFLVLTSYYEGLPMVLLEAKACGLPAISFSCPTGPDEIIRDGINGYLIPCYCINDMVERIDNLITCEKELQELSQNTQIDIEKFDKNTIMSQWIKLFDELTMEGNV